jgi:hypothetical protein
MTTTYTIEDGNTLVELFHGVPADSWEFPGSAAEIKSIEIGDFGGECFCHVIVLSDKRTIVATISGPIHNEGQRVIIYPSLDDAWAGDNGKNLVSQTEASKDEAGT